ncbi:acyltransferase family protein [Skermanella sp. TT6]|uniref:Acyltransferase family protein n=1 Tax=Skermanella cutis TaxID=2775420 RepID=A0ABX7B878_9PROT|nr:acyltransferase family protein [Skermanella sp. TT6]QQP89805.1 acyltransferase family protein [Skermanella sp. TT6]
MSDETVAWVQCAKGITICLVVYGHAMFGVDAAVGINPTFFFYNNEFFSLFRMPLFFFVSGIFAFRSIARPLDQFVNRTVLHFVYVYLVWCVIQYVFRLLTGGIGNQSIDPYAILLIAYQPINVLWFVYVLLAFFVVTRLLRPVPYFVVLALAGGLAVAHVNSGVYVVDRFTSNYVFFLMGYYGSQMILDRARQITSTHAMVLVPLFIAVTFALIYADLRHVQIVRLAVVMFAIFAMIALCVVLSDRKLDGLFLYAGSYSLPIFVSHTIATAGSRVILSKLGLGNPVLLVVGSTLGGIVLPIILAKLCDRIRFPWLFRKPGWFSVHIRSDDPPPRRAPSEPSDHRLADTSARP